MRLLVGLVLCGLVFSCQKNEKKTKKQSQKTARKEALQVLLIGTFHFENFDPSKNGDIIQKKICDVLTENNQKELARIAKKIVAFAPTKIFVEYPFKKQAKLDTIYQAFPSKAIFKHQKRNEIYQLAFRVAKQLQHNKIFAMDVRTHFPYDSLITQMKKAKQFDLIQKDQQELDALEASSKELFNSNKSLSEMICYYNKPAYRKKDINWYVSLANQGGERHNFIGAYLASEWYKRNLYMYSIIQKSLHKTDKRIMVLAGSSHAAMFNSFIAYNPEWETVELEEIMK